MWSDVQAQRQQGARDRQRVRRQSLTPEQREELNARQRERRRNITPEQREERNARQRERRRNLAAQRQHDHATSTFPTQSTLATLGHFEQGESSNSMVLLYCLFLSIELA